MSRLPWVSASASKNHHGQQCAICGDAVRDDIMGDGTAVRLEGSSIIVQFVQADDQILEAKRDSMKVRSLVQRDRVVLERKGKRAADQLGLLALLLYCMARRLRHQLARRRRSHVSVEVQCLGGGLR